ncbi:MAG: helix-turn-helix domain-containing protein [Oscillospiraceae bacterium]|jgi:transcriptional regulator with XRE-family HTH domain|nr:helix-turn-helix domain-containing protein [Oscillospiraceae bacterium]
MSEKIRGLREDKDLTQKQLARYLNVDQSTYSDYETGNLNIPIAVLVKLSIFYETSVDYLLDLTDNTNPYKRKSGV